MDTFDQLLELVERSKEDEAEAIWNLLLTLQTNSKIEDQILNIEEDILNVKRRVNEPRNLYRIIYNLQIIQSLIFEYRKTQESKLVLYVENKDVS